MTDGILAPSAVLQRADREAADALTTCSASVKPFALPKPEIALHQFYALMSAGGAAGSVGLPVGVHVAAAP